MAQRTPDIFRRRTLKTGLGATALFLPAPYAWVWAQSEGSVKLLLASKQALVIGNSGYKGSPLKNPANDARAIGEALKGVGFDVTTKLDASHADFTQAVLTYTQSLARRQAVGLFYFAGHGLQLAWRNYMVPVDANVRAAADIQAQCVELGDLLAGIAKARNPLNIIILDACRDNPLGSLGGIVDQKGLSQVDAPPRTLLAYATAPGNVASDGEGANGLYTEHLLKEIVVPEVKVEDVFKRVRLNVRRRTNGQQVPWENTSLEEDFYFIPPKELKRISELVAVQLFEQELALWESIKISKEPRPFEDYLRRYPSGRFSELAQLRLDQLLAQRGEKKIEIASQNNNPYTKGSAIANTNYKIGDFYSYRSIDPLTRKPKGAFSNTVSKITDAEIMFDSGLVTDLLGNRLRGRGGRRWTDIQEIPLEYAVGKKWNTSCNVINQREAVGYMEMDFRIVSREQITVPAGAFDAFYIEGRGQTSGVRNDGNNEALVYNYWHAPTSVRRPVVFEEIRRVESKIIYSNREELVAFKQS